MEIGDSVEELLDAEGRLPIVVGRFVVSHAARPEIASAVETAFALAGSLEARMNGAERVRTFRRGLHCPRCGRESVDAKRHGSPGNGVCTRCGTLFSVLATTA